MRTIGVVTVGRSDYGIYVPILKAIQSDPDLDLLLIVAGAHYAEDFGRTVEAIVADGFPIAERVVTPPVSDSPEATAKAMGAGTMAFAAVFARRRPDIVLVLGDRYEMHAAAVAALPQTVPVAHIHGGELTEGAFDDALRHSMTKLSHLHFVSTEAYRRRVLQMGEEDWRVVVSGAPALDNLRTMSLPIQGSDFPPLLVTFHPVTLERADTEYHIAEFLAALDIVGLPVLFTHPNADPGYRTIAEAVSDYVASHPSSRLVANMGTAGYFSAMKHAKVMVGNSSSGIVEAASFELPVVNIGTRQQGRIRARNVIDTGYSRHEITEALRRALSPEFHNGLAGMTNPYGDGHAAERIVGALKTISLDERLLKKRFVDMNPSPSGIGLGEGIRN